MRPFFFSSAASSHIVLGPNDQTTSNFCTQLLLSLLFALSVNVHVLLLIILNLTSRFTGWATCMVEEYGENMGKPTMKRLTKCWESHFPQRSNIWNGYWLGILPPILEKLLRIQRAWIVPNTSACPNPRWENLMWQQPYCRPLWGLAGSCWLLHSLLDSEPLRKFVWLVFTQVC